MSASSQCPHSDVDWNIHFTHMADSNVGSVQINATCKICGKGLRLNRGLPMGASSRFPTRASDDAGSLGVLLPVIADDEEPTKEWGFAITREVVS